MDMASVLPIFFARPHPCIKKLKYNIQQYDISSLNFYFPCSIFQIFAITIAFTNLIQLYN